PGHVELALAGRHGLGVRFEAKASLVGYAYAAPRARRGVRQRWQGRSHHPVIKTDEGREIFHPNGVRAPFRDRTQRTSSSSTSNTSVELGGITGGNPRAPYASSGGMVSRRTSPIFIPATPWSQPLMTSPAPSLKLKPWLRSRELSNF